jgi:hypothetical protein
VLARWFWLCPAISFALAAAVLTLVGVSWWTALVAAGLAGCVVAAAWVVVADRSSRRALDRASARHERIRPDGDREDV